MTDRDIMQQALDALEQSSTNAPFDAHGVVYVEGVKIHKAAIAALNERLAQPEQEPVAVHQFRKPYTVDWYDPYKTRTPYTAPPQRTWVGLTDDEIDELSRTMVKGNKSANWLCRAIEAKLKEKNNGN